MSGRDPLAALQRLAALRAQRALAALAAARAREADEAARLAATVEAAAETFPTGAEPGTLALLWQRRMAVEKQGDAIAARHADRRAEAAEAQGKAGEAVARELGAAALAQRAALERARADARRHERSMGVLSALRGPRGL